MPSAEYLRMQAATCLRWAANSVDIALVSRLQSMAEEFLAKAAELEAPIEPASDLNPTAAPDASFQAGGDDT